MKYFAAMLLGFALTLAFPAAGAVQDSTTASNGESYKAALADLIDRSDRIVVTEHSFETDLRGESPEEFVYATKTLTSQQRKSFAALIRSIDGTLPKGVDYCAIEPHHRVEFYSKGETLSTMEICFVCGQVEWDLNRSTPPQALYRALETFVNSIGLQAEQDWRARAKAEFEARSPRPGSSLEQPR